ncbi:MAG: ParA family protein [Prevotella sp.]|nr:ParA family protein [Prevotella sp.]
MDNKVIITTSLKGGVGKTSLCANFATFFVEQGVPVFVLDADIQQSLSRHRKRDLEGNPSTDIPWPVEFLNTTDIEMVKSVMKKAKQLQCCVMIDCPGNIQDPALQVIYEAADMAIIPYELNSDSVDATIMFAKLFKKNYKAKMFFVPNKVSTVFEWRGEVRKAREDAVEALNGKLGTVTPDMRLTTHLNGYSTIETYNWKKRAAIRDAFAPIFHSINK